MPRCLVTGGAGFIGSNLVDALLAQKNDVYVIDDESSSVNSRFYWSEDANNHRIDILDFFSCEKIFDQFKPDFVFHLAAHSRIPIGIKNPVECCNTNVMGTCNMLQLSRTFGVKRFIFSSTSSVYGLKNTPPLKEDMTRDCLNPYSVSKSAAEDLCEMYNNLFGLETVIFRYFNVYGERQPLKGQYAPVIGIFQKQMEEGKPMTIVGNGDQTRDFTHVSDVVAANILAADLKNSKIIGEKFNIGSGTSHSINEVSKLVAISRKEAWCGSWLPPREGEARDTLADLNKSKELLGYKPKIFLENWLNNCNNI